MYVYVYLYLYLYRQKSKNTKVRAGVKELYLSRKRDLFPG